MSAHGYFMKRGRRTHSASRFGAKVSMPPEFVHLHCHSQYSFLTGAVKLSALAKAAKQKAHARGRVDRPREHVRRYPPLQQPVERKASRPILGCEVNVAREGQQAVDHLVLLAATNEGYKNLIRLVSEGHLRPKSELGPSISSTQIAERNRGHRRAHGVPRRRARAARARARTRPGLSALSELRDVFEKGRLFVELQDHGFAEQGVVNDILVKAARAISSCPSSPPTTCTS